MPGFKEKAKKHQVSRDDINEAVLKIDGLLYTKTIAKKYYNKYLKTLNELELTKKKKEGLEAILKKAYRIL